MYSKNILVKYIDEKSKQKGLPLSHVAEKLGMSASNFTRAIKQEEFNLTLPQFARLIEVLDFTQEQVYHILTGKNKKAAVSQLVHAAAKKLVDDFC